MFNLLAKESKQDIGDLKPPRAPRSEITAPCWSMFSSTAPDNTCSFNSNKKDLKRQNNK